MMEVLVVCLHLGFIIALSVYLRRRWSWNPWIFWPALGLKLAAGICLGLFYRYYFEVGDTFAYFNDGRKLAAIAVDDLSLYFQMLFLDRGVESAALVMTEPRALFFSKMTSLLNIVTNNNYWAISFYYSFLSFRTRWCRSAD